MPAPDAPPLLWLGSPGSHHEREAEQQAAIAADSPAHHGVSRADSAGATPVDPAVTRRVLGAQGGGHALPGSVRRRYQSTARTDLSLVRLHTGSVADGLNAGFESSAFTVGHHIFFRDGAYNPASHIGREVLRHELHHVAQQQGSADGTRMLIQRARKPKQRAVPNPAKKKRRKKRNPDNAAYRGNKSLTPQRAKPGIPVDYIDLPVMEDRLKQDFEKKGRSWGKDPAELFIGAAVWNVNHLSADEGKGPGWSSIDQAEVEAQIARLQAAIQLVKQTAEDVKESMEEIPYPIAESPTPFATPKESEESSYRFHESARPFGEPEQPGETTEEFEEASDAEDQESEGEEDEEEHKENKKGGVGQLATDISTILENELSEVIALGLRAKAAWARRDQASVAGRATQLHDMRNMKQLWNRLDRILDNARSQAAPSTAQAQLERAQVEAIADDIRHILKEVSSDDLKEAADELKRAWMADLITDKFPSNPNIKIVLLNEVNTGIEDVEDAAADSGLSLKVSRGPVMQARGERVGQYADRKGKVSTSVRGKTYWGTGKQTEYYPAVYHAGDTEEDSLEAAGTFYVNTRGQFAIQDTATNENNAIGWNKAGKGPNKKDQSFRGIVVHRFVQNNQEFWMGVIHTTPAGSNLDRKKIWPQLVDPLTKLHVLAARLKMPLLIGGDFYISAEAIVTDPKNEPDKAEERNDIIGSGRFWYLATNIFRLAEQNNRLHRLRQVLDRGLPSMEIETAAEEVPRGRQARAAEKEAKPKVQRLRRRENGADNVELWDEFVSYLQDMLDVNSQENKSPDAVIAKLNKLAADIGITGTSWDRTLAAGKLGGTDQFIRNVSGITMEKQLKEIGYRIVGGVAPTNPKEKGAGEDKWQVADLFIGNELWATAAGGVVTPSGDITLLDDEGQTGADAFAKGSDHLPVVAMASTKASDRRVGAAYAMPPDTDQNVRRMNQDSWDRLMKRLYGFGVLRTGTSGTARMDEFGAANQEIPDPTRGNDFGVGRLDESGIITAEARKLIHRVQQIIHQPLRDRDEQIDSTVKSLITEILWYLPRKESSQIPGNKKDVWQALLNDIARWSLYYGLDFGQDRYPAGERYNRLDPRRMDLD